MLVNTLPIHALYTMSSLGWDLLGVIINFLVVWFICLNSCLFQGGPWMKFLVHSLIAINFHVLLSFFLWSLFVWLCLFPIFSSTCNFPVLQLIWCFFWFVYYIPPVVYSLFFITNNSACHIPSHVVCRKVSNSFFKILSQLLVRRPRTEGGWYFLLIL